MNPIKSHILNRLRPQVQPMTETEYLPLALRTWTAPLRGTKEGRDYLAKGLLSELGEVSDVLKKATRNKTPPDEVRRRLVDEIGDVLWYSAVMDFECESDTAAFWFDLPPFVRTMLAAFNLNSFLSWAIKEHGITADECRAANIAKLASRAERGVIQGSGGDR